MKKNKKINRFDPMYMKLLSDYMFYIKQWEPVSYEADEQYLNEFEEYICEINLKRNGNPFSTETH